MQTYEKAYHEEQDTLFTMHDLVHDLATLLLGDEIMDQSKDGNTLSSSCRYALLTDSSKPLELRLPSCARLTALRFIHCRRTQLCGAAFAPANSLRVLDLSECHIQKLPESIGQLQQLRYLKAPEIQDGLIPNCITKLSELKYLDISGSEISALPESIGEMADLVHLDISSCSQIEQLPVSFRNLENLVHLDLSNCSRITGVSESLGSLEGLQHLDLSFCTCIGEQLPEALGSLTKLQYLNLSKCSYIQSKDTSMFPSIREKKSSHIQAPEAEVLGNLSKLKYLNLSSKSSPLRRLPEALGTFTGLEYLNLSGCRLLEELPASFGELCSLVHLNLSNCFCLNNIWDALRVLTKLQYLNLHQCSINVSFEDLSSEGLEEAMKNLTELWFLDLSNSVYLIYGGQSAVDKFVLDWISNLTNLEHLNLASNHAHHTLPDAFGKLKKLHTLDLSHCFNLKRLPKSISEIDSLKFLNTVDCDELDKSTLPQFKHSSTLLPPHFVVHTGDGECSSNLVLLKDEDPTILEISRLENVKSAEEAQMIKLLDKQMISELKFNWTRDAERFVEDIEVLKELVPPSSVDKLELQGYDSLTFPSWMMGITSYLPQLGTVSLEEIPSCSALPPLGQLPNLVCLTIEHMPGIRKIGKEFYGGERPFPALEQFYVCNMDNLLEWNTICYSDDGDANVLVLPRVVEWIIRECPILSFKPCPPIGGQLWQIEKSDNVMLSGGGEIYFDIGSFDSDIVVTSVLEVHCCQLPLHQWALLLHLPALETLRIENCSDLTCSSLDDILGGLSTLKKLNVMDCESFTELQDFLSSSDILGGRTSLWKLEVVRCESITALPDCLGNLTSLGVISIFNCPNIKRLPESIRQLTNLRYLDISDDCSPELIQWCESDEEIKKVLYIAQRRQRSHPTVWYVSEE
jgi:Leucine-rich repeat (LRR) protein